MTKKKRYTFSRFGSGTPANCYYCKSKTLSALSDSKDGSEVWSCNQCAYKIARIRRLKKIWGKKTPLDEKSEKNVIFTLEKSKKGINEAGGEMQDDRN